MGWFFAAYPEDILKNSHVPKITTQQVLPKISFNSRFMSYLPCIIRAITTLHDRMCSVTCIQEDLFQYRHVIDWMCYSIDELHVMICSRFRNIAAVGYQREQGAFIEWCRVLRSSTRATASSHAHFRKGRGWCIIMHRGQWLHCTFDSRSMMSYMYIHTSRSYL